jgi:hypothetical protein
VTLALILQRNPWQTGYRFPSTQMRTLPWSALYAAVTRLDAPVIALRGNMIRKRDRQRIAVDLVPLGNAPLLRRLTRSVSA